MQFKDKTTLSYIINKDKIRYNIDNAIQNDMN